MTHRANILIDGALLDLEAACYQESRTYAVGKERSIETGSWTSDRSERTLIQAVNSVHFTQAVLSVQTYEAETPYAIAWNISL